MTTTLAFAIAARIRLRSRSKPWAAGAPGTTPDPRGRDDLGLTHNAFQACRAVRSKKCLMNSSLNGLTTGAMPPRYLDDALILMSTPAGRLSLLSASIVFAVACTMSITRLCVRISYCCLAFLSMWGLESTV